MLPTGLLHRCSNTLISIPISFHYHYDGRFVPLVSLFSLYLTNSNYRFAEEPLPDNETLPYLSALIQTYLSTMTDLRAETWIMHGSLLAWWWNQKVTYFEYV